MTRFTTQILRTGFLVAALALLGFLGQTIAQAPSSPATAQGSQSAAPPAGLEVATFASGCFWCTESDFDKIDGVVETVSGYIGGHTENPTYKQVTSGTTGHTEALRVTYDPRKVSFEKLLAHYWHNVDPFDGTGQFCDRGSQYRPGIFYHNEAQRTLAEASKAAIAKRFKQPIAVEITKATTFTDAEAYHQDYYTKEPIRYRFYRYGCGRDARLDSIWGDERKTH